MATLSTSGWAASIEPMRPDPVTTLRTPGGSPASLQISAKSRADRRVYVAGFITTVLPHASAGAIFHTCNDDITRQWCERCEERVSESRDPNTERLGAQTEEISHHEHEGEVPGHDSADDSHRLPLFHFGLEQL